MSTVRLIFPHQLFKGITPAPGEAVYLIEEYLFFNQYRFHRQKLIFHRASMKAYADHLESRNVRVTYIEATSPLHDIRKLIPQLASEGVARLVFINPTDNWLEKRIRHSAAEAGMELEFLPSGLFINTETEIETILGKSKNYFQTRFYIDQRKRRGVLLDAANQPIGGKWSFDDENRLKYPAGKVAPKVTGKLTPYHKEAKSYVDKHFHDNPGTKDSVFPYPVTNRDAELWLEDFFMTRFSEFGVYEDAIVKNEHFLHHSILTPMLNTGLLDPTDVIRRAISHAEALQIPINSLEGFVRQILGWREFVRGVYQVAGTRQRTRNFWGFERKIPSSFYDGTTGIEPVDSAIRKLLETGYNHHIERLMVLSNFMLLCEFDPDEVYRWFMEMYIDSYDWVMVPNVYGMGQFADGGLLSTKPYISGSNYICKMSDHSKTGAWTKTWDALFWRFIHVHRDFFSQNPRLGMMVRTFDKMDPAKKNALLHHADDYLSRL